MMFAVVTLVHTAESLEQLDADSEAIMTVARKHLCHMATLRYQQLDGLCTALPIGTRRIDAFRTLTTEALAVLMPFRVQEIADTGGIWGGENAISGNLILYDKATLQNPNAFVLGVPGSGKSFITKELIAFLALATDDDIIICDPEREFAALIDALGGEVIRISAGSEHHINVMDMAEGYGEGANPVIDKSEFILSLFEQLDSDALGPRERSIIDRCVAAVYEDFRRTKVTPTLMTLYDKLIEQPEPEARGLALSLELFTSGTLDVFAHPTNVDTKNRRVVYDIMDLGRQLKTMGLLVVTDAMLNRTVDNWKAGKRTHIFLDEFHVVFENEYSGAFFNSAWRRFRKRDAHPTAITQNVEYLLDSVLASTMLSNSEFIIMLNQAAADREKLAGLLNISSEQLSYITNADAGSGLLRYGSSLVPFVNKWPRQTKLYGLMTTRPSDFLDSYRY
jgi:type IV secretory pathway VirB4 component